MTLHMSAIPNDVKALQQQLAAKGLLKSGNMLRGVLAIAQKALTTTVSIAASTMADQTVMAPRSAFLSSLVTTRGIGGRRGEP